MFVCKSNERSCLTLSSILNRYEQDSCKSINLYKSSITFASKTNPFHHHEAKRILKIRNEDGCGKYLCIPENFGQKKKKYLRIPSWTSRFLSKGGKQVLLQSILTYMPSYSMSCFKLPISLGKKIQSMLIRFWWDDKSEKKRCVGWRGRSLRSLKILETWF